MKHALYKRLQHLEQDVQSRPAGAERAPSGHIEIIRGWLSAWGVEQQPEESLAMTLSRALGMTVLELRNRLRERACT
jgi:hypothetical protein